MKHTIKGLQLTDNRTLRITYEDGVETVVALNRELTFFSVVQCRGPIVYYGGEKILDANDYYPEEGC